MEIINVSLRHAPMASSWLTERLIANPMSIFPEYVERRSSWYGSMSSGVVTVQLEDGTEGHGFVGSGKATAAACVLDEQVRGLVEGKTCFETELISEQLHRATVYYGRGGIVGSLLSGIDIALWDAKGKVMGRPVYDLLGGKAQEALLPYLTSWEATTLEELGVRDVKLAMPYGPAHGVDGMRRNVDVVEQAAALVGDDGWIALDCYMAWDVPYTVEMARRLEKFNIAWIEEPVLPNDYEGYRRIKDSVDCMISGGEHVFTLDGFDRLITEGGVDIVQPDIYRAGGPTVLTKVATLAKSAGRRLMCHGIGLATYHFMISLGRDVAPRCEYLDIHANATAPWLFTPEPRPQNGTLRLNDAPGFGYELSEDALSNPKGVAPVW
jgi:L-rhamnonate dehydratase